jgi:hypothetical protein
MVKVLSKSDLYKLREKLRSDIITKLNNQLKKSVNKLINGNEVTIDMADLEITKASTEFIIDYFNETKEWEVSLSKEPSMNPTYSHILIFKLI